MNISEAIKTVAGTRRATRWLCNMMDLEDEEETCTEEEIRDDAVAKMFEELDAAGAEAADLRYAAIEEAADTWHR